MRDDDTTPRVASTSPEAELLAVLDTIPRAALPDGPARDLLVRYCRAGAVDNLYRPFGADYWLIAWATFPPERDPRQRLDDWLALVSDARLTSAPTDATPDLLDDPLWRKLIGG